MYDVFDLPERTFPGGFLWGSATAGHQIEGDNVHAQRWALERRSPHMEPSGKACNSWELYRRDAELLAELGHRAYRLSIEWSRIEPAEGRWDDDALDRYVDNLTYLNERGVRPVLTLHHNTHPQWFDERGGFSRRDNLRFFERFCERVVPRLADLVHAWIPLNELNISTKPGRGELKLNMVRAHGLAYRLIKRHASAPVGTAHAYTVWMPRRAHDPMDRALARHLDAITNEFFFHAIRTGELVHPRVAGAHEPDVRGSADFWGINYYTRTMADARSADCTGERFRHKRLRMIDRPFYMEEFFPEGLIAACERLSDRPIHVTEHGVSCDDDRWRIVNLALHLDALGEAIAGGADVRGYLHWSLMDNYEWESYAPRFGLCACDRETFERTPKPSAWYYKDVIEANRTGPDILRRHLDELPTLGG